MKVSYSILMSVYAAERPERLVQSVQSMMEQTLPPGQFVLVCDGPLTAELDAAIADLCLKYPVLEIVKLKENVGLGQALNAGLAHCENEFVVRMDSDDIARADRCEKQIEFMSENNLGLCSATVTEFVGDMQFTGNRVVPVTHDELIKFARSRNPMNHPCVIFKKSIVEKVGGYRHMPLFEDFYLWARVILAGGKLGNHPEPLLYMRAGTGLYLRRSGFSYLRKAIRFWNEMRRIGFCGFFLCYINIAVRCVTCLLPQKLLYALYNKKMRSR